MTYATYSPNMPQGGFPQGGLAHAMSQTQGSQSWPTGWMPQQPQPQPTGWQNQHPSIDWMYDPAMMQMLRSGDWMGFLRSSAPEPQAAPKLNLMQNPEALKMPPWLAGMLQG